MDEEQQPKKTGRPRGSVGKRTLDAQKRLEELGCDPLKALAQIVNNLTPEGLPYYSKKITRTGDVLEVAGYDAEVRARAAAELASYLYPKRKAIEHSGETDNNFSVEIVIDAEAAAAHAKKIAEKKP